MALPETITLKEAVMQFLKVKPGDEFKSRELATELKAAFPVRFEKKEVAQLAAEIGAGAPKWLKQYSDFHCSEETPRKYWWEAAAVSIAATAMPTIDPEVTTLSESALYPLLATFLISRHRKIYPKRIDEKKSSNSYGKDGNKWLHPDMVGLEDLASGWDYQMKDLTAKAGARQAKLWSFEVKLDITRSKVREYYFQAVSNSTWANYGYLVAPKIKADALTELRLLNELHGIGVIQLDPVSPTDSIIEIPAHERRDVDWGTCNRIADENKDFLKYVKLIAQFYDTKGTSIKEWDVPDSALSDD
jgi:hypothetical protein